MVQIKTMLKKVDSYTDYYKSYDIYEGVDDALHCSCPSSIYRDTVCKHMRDFFITPEYDSWFAGKTSKAESPLAITFDSSGTITIVKKSDDIYNDLECTLTPAQCEGVVKTLEEILPFMRFYAKMN